MSFKKNSLNSAYDSGLRRCPICDVQLVWKAHTPSVQPNLATVDHIVPKSIGGGDTPRNMFVMCRKCNEKRGNYCFVKYVMKAGISPSYAKQLYRDAHIATLQLIIWSQFTSALPDRKTTVKINKRKRKQIRDVIKNHTYFFGDYLPEFELLQKLL